MFCVKFWDSKFFQFDVVSVHIVVPTWQYYLMSLLGPWIEPGKYRKAMLISVLHKSSYSFPTFHDNSFPFEYWMLAMEEFHIFFPSDIQETTNVLLSFFIESVYYCGFVRFFNKYVGFLDVPKRVPYFVERNIFYKLCSFSAQMFQKCFYKVVIFDVILLKPLSLFILAFKVERLFNANATCIYWVTEFSERVVGRKEKLLRSYPYFLQDAISSKQWMHSLVIDLDSVTSIQLQIQW